MANFPHPIKSFIRANLNEEMSLIRTIVNLGHSLRAAQKIKTRQPLTSATVVSPYKLNEEELQVIAEELNVKEIHMMTEAESTIHRAVKPKASVLGPKYGKDVQKIIDAAKNDNFTLDADGRALVDGTFTLEPEEFEIVYQTEPGLSVMSQENIVVALDTKLTDDLIQEGYAREIVRHIQELRKAANYKVDSRINVGIEVQSESELAHNVLSKFSSYISRETLADSISSMSIIPDIEDSVSIDKLKLHLKLEQVKKKA
jgi:isoleucyl-tRNA synthetase